MDVELAREFLRGKAWFPADLSAPEVKTVLSALMNDPGVFGSVDPSRVENANWDAENGGCPRDGDL